jgi:SpoU rRNA methylase family enzyme
VREAGVHPRTSELDDELKVLEGKMALLLDPNKSTDSDQNEHCTVTVTFMSVQEEHRAVRQRQGSKAVSVLKGRA